MKKLLCVVLCIVLLLAAFAFVACDGYEGQIQTQARAVRVIVTQNAIMTLQGTHGLYNLSNCIVQIDYQGTIYYFTYIDGQIGEESKTFPTVTVKVGETEETLAQDGYRVVGSKQYHKTDDPKEFISTDIFDTVVVYLSSAAFADLRRS